MSSRERLTLAAALAVALGTAAVVPLYAEVHWVLRALGAVAAVAAAGLVARRANLPAALQPVATTAALGYYLCLVFARASLGYGALPTWDTLHALDNLLQAGLTDIDRLSPPVPSNTGLTMIAAAGIGAVAVAVDLVAVVMGRAAAAGLPLLVLFAVPSAVLPGGLGWLPFLFVAAGWMILMLVEGADRVSRWGTPLESARPERALRHDDTSLGRVGRRIGAAALGIAVVVPALIPGLNGRLVGGNGNGNGPGHGSRTTTTYNPIVKLRDDLRLPKERDVLVYATNAAPPDYLRMTTLDRFNEAGWSSSKLSGDPKRDGVKGTLPQPVGLDVGSARSVRVQVRIRTLDAQWLPVPAVPSRVDVDGPWLYDRRSETVFGIRTGTKKLTKTYTVTSVQAVPNPAVLEAAIGPARTPDDVRPYAVDPGAEVTDSVRTLTNGIVAGKRSPYARVAALQAFFTNPASGFRYSLSSQVPGIDSPNALEAFLKGRAGFCEQYASAMAAMIRIAGLPARVAVGFTPGKRQKDGSYRVTTADAHAWPEAWFAGAGWIRFEPTPRRDGQTVVPAYAAPGGATAPGSQDPRGGGPSPSAGPDPAQSASGNAKLDQLDRIQNQGGIPAASAATARPRHRSYVLPALGGLAALLLLPRLLHAVRRRRRWLAGAATAGWEQVREDAVDIGHRWRPADSPRAGAAALSARYALDAPARDALGRLAVAAELSRYGRDGAVHGADELAAAAALVRSSLRAGVGRVTRVRSWLLPTSALSAAASASGTFVAELLDRSDQAWSSMRRLLGLGRLRRRRTA
ncbi:MAG: DUF3488 and transglutaminase-like domain-containing protein [Mycobacteriales bacterium]